MKNVYVNIKAVIRATGAIEEARNPAEKESIVLIIWPRGFGKTRFGVQLVARDPQGLYLRGRACYEGRITWFMRDLCRELGYDPRRNLEDVWGQVIGGFRESPRIVIIDEIARLLKPGRLIEVLKDLHDECSVPLIFLGEPGIDRALSRYPSVLDRVSRIVTFTPLDREDICLVARSLLECEITDEGLEALCGAIDPGNARFRPIKVMLSRLERYVRDMGLDAITGEIVEGMFSGKGVSRRQYRNMKMRKPASAA